MNGYTDERVVSMKFDNKQFEQGARESMNTLDKLKEKLNFKGAVQGLDSVGSEASKLNTSFNDTINAVESISNKFSVLEVAAITAISRITNKVIDLGEKLATSLTVDQLSAGWAKYESKISSVQTIMAATASTWQESAKAIGFAGDQMEYVSAMLDKLNWFSDETSYNFADMTNNIGKFTSSGVALDKSVEAMEGISVWAAKSGQNAQTASRAYYNLAQAISVGSVKLIDWKSIENANMATMEFKQTAIDTAVAMGTLKKVSKGVYETLKGSEVTVRNFNEGLKDQWFTSEVLMNTLKDYGRTTTFLSDIYDTYGTSATEFLGALDDYNEGTADIVDISSDLGIQIKELIPLFETLNSEEYKLSLSAFRAAQEAKTFTEVIDATKDAVSTGWMNTFELIFGNYEQAKKLWSDMAEEFYYIFNGGAEGRNEMLADVMSDSWTKLTNIIQATGVSTEKFSDLLIKELRNSGVPIDDLIEKYGTLREAIRHIDDIKQHVINVIKSLTSPITEGADAINDVTGKLDEFQNVVNKVIRGEFSSGKARIDKLTSAGYNYVTVQGLVNKVWEKNGHTWKDTTITMDDLVEVMTKMSDKELENIGLTQEQVDLLKELQDAALESGSTIDELLDSLTKKSGRELFFDSLLNIAKALRVAINAIREAWIETFPRQDKAIYGFIDGFHSFTEWLIMGGDALDRFKRIFKGVFSLLGLVGDVIGSFVRVFFPEFAAGIGTIGGGLAEFLARIADKIVAFREFAKDGDLFGNIFQYLKDMMSTTMIVVADFIESLKEIPGVGAVFSSAKGKFESFFNFIKELWHTFYDELTSDGGNIITAFEKVFAIIGDTVMKLYKKAEPYLKNIKIAFGNFFEYFKTAGGNIMSGILEGILRFDYKSLWNAIIEVAKGMVDAFCEYMGIHSPATRWIQMAIDCIRGLIAGFAQMINKAALAVRDFVKALFREVEQDAANPKISPFEKIKEITTKTLLKIVDFFKGFLGTIGEFFKAFGHVLTDENLFYRVISAIKSLLSVLLLLNAVRISNVVPTVLLSWSNSFRKIANSIKTYFRGLTVKNYAVVARNLTFAIGLIALSVYGLSKLPPDKFDQALKALTMFENIIIALGGVMALVIAVSGWAGKVHSFDLFGKFIWLSDTKAAKAASSSIIQMAGLIASIGVGMFLFTKSFETLADIISKESISDKLPIIQDAFIAITTGLFALMGAAASLSVMCKGTSAAMAGLSLLLLSVTASMYLVLEALNIFFMDPDSISNIAYKIKDFNSVITFLTGALGIVVTIAGLIFAAGAISKITSGLSIGNGTAIAVMLVSIGITLHLIFGALSNLVTTLISACEKIKHVDPLFATEKGYGMIADFIVLSLLGTAAILAAIFGGMAILAAALKRDKSMVIHFGGAALFLAVFAASMFALVESFGRLDELMSQLKSPVKTMIGFIVGMAGLITAIRLVKKADTFNAALIMAGFAAVIVAFGHVIDKIFKLGDVYKAINILGYVSLCVTAMIGMLTLFNKHSVSSWQTGLINVGQLLSLGLMMYVLGETLTKLSTLPWEQLRDTVILIGMLIGSLMAISTMMSGASWAGAGEIFAIAGAVGILGYSLSTLIGTLEGVSDWQVKLATVVTTVAGLLVLLLMISPALSAAAAAGAEAIGVMMAIAVAIALVAGSIAALISSIALLLSVLFEITEKLEDNPVYKFFTNLLSVIKEIVTELAKAVALTYDMSDSEWWKRKTNAKPGDYIIAGNPDSILGSITLDKDKWAWLFGANGLLPYDAYNTVPYPTKSESVSRATSNSRTTSRQKNVIDGEGTVQRRGTGLGFTTSNRGLSNQVTRDISAAITDSMTSNKVTRAYSFNPYGVSSQNNSGSGFNYQTIQNSLQEQINQMSSGINVTDYQSTISSSIEGMQNSINDTISNMPFGDKIANAMGIRNNMQNMINGIEVDMPEIDTSGLLADLNMDDLFGNINLNTDALGLLNGTVSDATMTLEELTEYYKDYNVKNELPLTNPDEIKGNKAWKDILKESGYASKEDYIKAYEEMLHNITYFVNPDDIGFTKVQDKKAYEDAYNKYVQYIDYQKQSKLANVEQMIYDFLYLNPDKRLGEEGNTALRDYVMNRASKLGAKDFDYMDKFFDSWISEFYNHSSEYINGKTQSDKPYYSPNDTSNIETKPVQTYSYSTTSSGSGFTSTSASQLQVQFPTEMNCINKDVVDAINLAKQSFASDISVLGDRISKLQVMLNENILVGRLTPMISRNIYGGMEKAERGM